MEDSTSEQLPIGFIPDFDNEDQLYEIWLRATLAEQKRAENHVPPDEYFKSRMYRSGVLIEILLYWILLLTVTLFPLKITARAWEYAILITIIVLLLTLPKLVRLRYPENFKLSYLSRKFYKLYCKQKHDQTAKAAKRSDLNFQSIEVLEPIARYVFTPKIDALSASGIALYHRNKGLESKREQLEKLARRVTDEITSSKDESWRDALRSKLTRIGELINQITQSIHANDIQSAELRRLQVTLENKLVELARRKRLIEDFKKLDDVNEDLTEPDIRKSLTQLVESAQAQLETINNNSLAYESARQEMSELLGNSS